MARAYQEAHILENLTSSVKTLQSQTSELSKAKGLHEERITNLLKQNEQQAKKIEALETRASANEHNTPARLQNAHLAHTPSLLAHTPLTPLHDLTTNRPIRHFPKHERDIRTMGASEVIQVLQALDIPVLGLSASEKKGELRVQVGLPREVGEAGKADGAAVAGKSEASAAPKVGKAGPPKVAPGSTAEKVGNKGTGAVEGVSKPGASAVSKTGAAKAAAVGAEKKA